jgi:hypothetical protein
MTAKRRGEATSKCPKLKGNIHLNVHHPNYTWNVVLNRRKYKGFGQKITWYNQVSLAIASSEFLEFFAQL